MSSYAAKKDAGAGRQAAQEAAWLLLKSRDLEQKDWSQIGEAVIQLK